VGAVRQRGHRFPWVWLTTQGNTATSVWIPPNETEFSDEQKTALAPAIVEMFDAKAPRVLHMLEMFDQAHREVFRTSI
jgi:hypothetical protein